MKLVSALTLLLATLAVASWMADTWAVMAVQQTLEPANQRQKHVHGCLKKVKTIAHKHKDDSCTQCKKLVEYGHRVAKQQPHLGHDVIKKLCKTYADSKLCDKYNLGEEENDNVFNMTSTIVRVLTLIDTSKGSLDAEYICANHFDGACDAPKTPKHDLEKLKWFKPRSKKEVERYHRKLAENTEHLPPTFNVVHVSDFHLDLRYTVGSEATCSQDMCCNVENFHEEAALNDIALSGHVTLSPAREQGEYQCDAPRPLVKSSLEHINRTINEIGDFAFSLFTGDMVAHNAPEHKTLNYTLESELAVYKYMKNNIGNLPVFSSLGNHDSYPFGQLSQASTRHKTEDWNAQLASQLWEEYDWVNTTQDELSNYAGYSVSPYKGLKVISLNSNYWYKSNLYNYWDIRNPDTSGMLRFLSDELKSAEKHGQRAWIIAHIPSGGNSKNAVPWAGEVFASITERFDHVVAGVFFGHTHQDKFSVQYRKKHPRRHKHSYKEKHAINVAWLGPSVTPIDDLNPSWRYYTINSSNFEVQDAHTYYTDLKSLDYKWQHLYSSRETYNTFGWPEEAPLNATFWHRVAHQIKDDAEVRQLYTDLEARNSPFERKCESHKCITKQYCYITSWTTDRYDKCRKIFK